MTDPKVSSEQVNVKGGVLEEAERVYKKEKRLVLAGVIVVILMAMGVFFMYPWLPQLLEIKVWGFPFPYFYQFFINWLGPILFGLLMLRLLDKNDSERERLAKEAEKTEAGGGS